MISPLHYRAHSLSRASMQKHKRTLLVENFTVFGASAGSVQLQIMKILALVFLLFGIVAAVPIEDLERAKDEVILSFMLGMEEAPSLQEAMNVESQELNEVEEEIKSELVRRLRETLEELLKKMKDAVDHGKTVKEDLLERVEKIKEHLKELKETFGTKLKQILERIKEKVKGKFREWLEKLTKSGSEDSEAYGVAYSGGLKESLHDFLTKLRNKIGEKGRDLKKIAEEVREKLKDHAMLAKLIIDNLRAETIEKVKEIIDKFLNRKESRSVKDLYEKIKDYLKEVHKDFQKHFSSFLDWLEKVYKSGSEAAKGRIENLKKVLVKFLKHVKEVGKQTADEALEFFRPYKEDLGTLWDELEKSIKETYGEHEKHH